MDATRVVVRIGQLARAVRLANSCPRNATFSDVFGIVRRDKKGNQDIRKIVGKTEGDCVEEKEIVKHIHKIITLLSFMTYFGGKG